MKTALIAFNLAIISAGPAIAECPASPPWSPSNYQAGDQKVNSAWMQANLVGKRVVFDDGTEVYGADGTYSYKAGTQSWDAPSYRFYNNGLRCIGYDTPRFDYYVVNNGQLVLGNANGTRHVGKITN